MTLVSSARRCQAQIKWPLRKEIYGLLSLRTMSSRTMCLRTIARSTPSIVASHNKQFFWFWVTCCDATATVAFLFRSGIADQTLLAKPSRTNSGWRHLMSFLGRSASRPGCAEVGFLRVVPGMAGRGSPSVRPLRREDHRKQRHASIMRASLVLGLLGLFCGSAFVMSEKPQPPLDAATVSPPAAAQAHVRAHAKANPIPPPSSFNE